MAKRLATYDDYLKEFGKSTQTLCSSLFTFLALIAEQEKDKPLTLFHANDKLFWNTITSALARDSLIQLGRLLDNDQIAGKDNLTASQFLQLTRNEGKMPSAYIDVMSDKAAQLKDRYQKQYQTMRHQVLAHANMFDNLNIKRGIVKKANNVEPMQEMAVSLYKIYICTNTQIEKNVWLWDENFPHTLPRISHDASPGKSVQLNYQPLMAVERVGRFTRKPISDTDLALLCY